MSLSLGCSPRGTLLFLAFLRRSSGCKFTTPKKLKTELPDWCLGIYLAKIKVSNTVPIFIIYFFFYLCVLSLVHLTTFIRLLVHS